SLAIPPSECSYFLTCLFSRGLSPGVTPRPFSEYPGLWRESRESKNAATPIRAARPTRQLASPMAGPRQRWAGRPTGRRRGRRRQAPEKRGPGQRAAVRAGGDSATARHAAAGRAPEPAFGPSFTTIAAGRARAARLHPVVRRSGRAAPAEELFARRGRRRRRRRRRPGP